MVATYTAKARVSEELRMANAKQEENESEPEDTTVRNQVKRVRKKTDSHVTQGLMNADDRRLMKKQLERDPILGKIMLQLREIVAGMDV